MKNRQNLKKLTPALCIICRINKANIAVVQISHKINSKKYFQPFQRRAEAQRLIAELDFRGRRSNQIKIQEDNDLINHTEFLKKYSNFRMTVTCIKETIMERVNRDFLQPLLPQEEIFNKIISNLNIRLNGGKRVQPFMEKKNGSGVSTQLGQRSQKTKKINQSYIAEKSHGESKRRLSRKLTIMFQQIDANIHFHPSLISQFTNGPSMSEIEMEIDQKFRQEMQDKFSIIQPIKLTISSSDNHLFEKKQNSYGLQAKLKQIDTRKDDKQLGKWDTKKKVSSRDQMRYTKQTIPYRAQTDYDCEAIQRQLKASKSNRQSKQQIRPLIITYPNRKKDNLKTGSLNKLQSLKRQQKHS